MPTNLIEPARLARVTEQHASQESFNRRLQKGQFHNTPCLGWREFVPDYVGTIRNDTENKKVQTSIKETLSSFLYCVFDPETGVRNPRYVQNLSGKEIVNGRLEYAE